MGWTKESDKSETWDKSSIASNTWSSKINSIKTWAVNRVHIIANKNFLKHRLCFGTYILGTLIFNGIGWKNNEQTLDTWDKSVKSDSWIKKSQANPVWESKETNSNTWEKNTKSAVWTKKTTTKTWNKNDKESNEWALK